MGEPQKPVSVKLICACTFTPGAAMAQVVKELGDRYGPTDHSFGPLDFRYTDYYRSQMGTDLKKMFYSFTRLIDPGCIADIKHQTNALEQNHSRAGLRTVNVDPGYLSLDKLVLATTKDFFHRLYLGNGIYAEVTLHLRKGKYRYFSWTYPDYREPALHTFLHQVRTTYTAQCQDAGQKGTG